MSTLAVQGRPVPGIGASAMIASIRAAEPRFFALALFLLMAMIPTTVATLIDARVVDGIELWGKVLKFELALAVYLFTLAFFARYVPAAQMETRLYRIYSGMIVVAISLEMIWIGGAAGIGTNSHFNTSTLGAIVYPLMGLAAILLTSASSVQAVLIARNPSTGLDPVVRQSIVLGLGLTLPLTLLTAGTLSGMGSHFVGGSGPVQDAFPLMGWAGDRGDLRVAHFFATHAMHALPLAGLAIAALTGRRIVWASSVVALGYCAFVITTFMQALAGRPFPGW